MGGLHDELADGRFRHYSEEYYNWWHQLRSRASSKLAVNRVSRRNLGILLPNAKL